MEKEEGLSILLVSCDKYMDIVRVFEQSAVKYWPTCPYKTYLLTESRDCRPADVPADVPRFFDEVLTAGTGKSWSDCLLYAVRHIPTRHILVMLDDFILSAPVDDAKIAAAYRVSRNKGAGICKLSPRDARGTAAELCEGLSFSEIGQDEPYRVSVNPPAIWDSSYIESLLDGHSVSAWDFEREGTVWSRSLEPSVLRLADESLFSFFDPTGDGAVGRGRLAKGFRDFCARESFVLETDRADMTWKDGAKKAVKGFIYRLNPALILRIQQWLFERRERPS
ncbi:MAG: hypothetical protein II932_01340 [Treponema sp.]|nr:hypothetical protein [Treponema sp.]